MTAEAPKKLVIIHGFGDNMRFRREFHEKIALNLGKRLGYETVVFYPRWHEEGRELSNILTDLDKEKPTHLLGTSAGGALAVLYALANPEKVSKVVAVSSRFNTKEHDGYLKMDTIKRRSPAFFEVLESLEQQTDSIEQKLPGKIMTIRPRSGDESVPSESSSLPGAENVVIDLTAPHIRGIRKVLTEDPGLKKIVDFLS